MNEYLLAYGEAAKALGDGKIRVPMVVFGGDGDLSSLKDRFTKNTDFEVPEWPAPCTLRFEHGQNEFVGTKAIGGGVNACKMYRSDDGIFVEGVLNIADSYEARIYKMVEDGKLGGSSGTVLHLIERKSLGNDGHEITKWPLGADMSLTPRPADPRTRFHELKSLNDIADAMKSLSGELFAGIEDALKELPLADRNRIWNSSAAVSRIRQWAGKDAKKEARAFIVSDSKSIPIADIINGELTAVPRAIIAAGIKTLDDNAKSALAPYYKRMNMETPWAEIKSLSIEEFAAKSQYFQDMDEELTICALSCLNSRFFYSVVWSVVYDEATTREEKIAALASALEEYKTYIAIVITGLMDEAEGTPDDDMKMLRTYWSDPKEFSTLPLRESMKQATGGLAETLERWDAEVFRFLAQGAKANMVLSKSNKNSLLAGYGKVIEAAGHMEDIMYRADVKYKDESTEDDNAKALLKIQLEQAIIEAELTH